MSNVSTDASSQSDSTLGSNGSMKVETGNGPPKYSQREYELEDFSQQRINRGQQEINYLITETNEKILQALNEFRTAIAELGSPDHSLEKVDDAIDEASKANARIAGPFPPGCVRPLSNQ
jgi:hypothetical protein